MRVPFLFGFSREMGLAMMLDTNEKSVGHRRRSMTFSILGQRRWAVSLAADKRLPAWLRRPVPHGEDVQRVEKALRRWKVHTVCHGASCPNRQECFSSGRLTFMILGDVCTRSCAFCGITLGTPALVDPGEPERVAAVAGQLGLSYVVVTSVTRDDLPDGGAAQFARTIETVSKLGAVKGVEVLIPDFKGSLSSLQRVVQAHPDVLNHNVETVPRLYPEVRPQASYSRSLGVLRAAKSLGEKLLTKSGLMLGLGETEAEVVAVMEDLRAVDCDFVTLGQYIRPSLRHRSAARYVIPDEFSHYQEIGLSMGFSGVASGPLVRSSFHAEQLYKSTASRGLMKRGVVA